MTECRVEVLLGRLDSIPPGEGRTFEVQGSRLAVFHTRAGQVFATQAECPHKGGPLADGLLGGTTLICPLHAWKFELTTGEPILGGCSVKTYPARVDESGRIVVEV
jgi:nitrite reductase (NADH) small subunit